MGLRPPCWGEEVAEAGVGPPEGRLWSASCHCSVGLVVHASVQFVLAVGAGPILALTRSVGVEREGEGLEEAGSGARSCAPSKAPQEVQQGLLRGLSWRPFP